MTPHAVSSIMGNPEFLYISDVDSTIYCSSYIYDETFDPKFAHVMFNDRKLVTAEDGFRTAGEI